MILPSLHQLTIIRGHPPPPWRRQKLVQSGVPHGVYHGRMDPAESLANYRAFQHEVAPGILRWKWGFGEGD